MGLLDFVTKNATGIGAITGAIDSIGNIFSQNSANKTNMKIAREANALQERMFNRNITNQWDMWNANNQYNSASSQRKRLEDAGLNPYLMMNTGNAGVAESTPLGSTPTPQTAHVEPARFNLGNAFSDLFQRQSMLSQMDNMKAEGERIRSETQRNNLGNFYEWMNMSNKLRQSKLDTDTKDFVKSMTKMQQEGMAYDFWINREFRKEELYNLHENTRLVQQQQITEKTLQELQRSGKHVNEKTIDQINASIKKIASDIITNNHLQKLYDSAASKNYTDVEVGGAKYWNIIYDTAGKYIDNIVKFMSTEEKQIYIDHMADLLDSEILRNQSAAFSDGADVFTTLYRDWYHERQANKRNSQNERGRNARSQRNRQNARNRYRRGRGRRR